MTRAITMHELVGVDHLRLTQPIIIQLEEEYHIATYEHLDIYTVYDTQASIFTEISSQLAWLWRFYVEGVRANPTTFTDDAIELAARIQTVIEAV